MTNLHMIATLTIMVMIYAIGHWLYRECARRRAWELKADNDRQEIRDVAETAANEAASCAAVIDKLGTGSEPPPQKRSRLRAVHDDRTGVSTWNWE